MDDRRPILVTGVHRSGTTIVGMLLAKHPSVGYVLEPFNIDHGILGLEHWYQYISASDPNEQFYRDLFDDLLAGRATYRTPPYAAVGRWFMPSRVAARIKRQVMYRRAVTRKQTQRVLLKDPLASFASEYLHRQFHMHTIIMVRHPASFAASVSRLGWTFDLSHFRNQPRLMHDHFADLADVFAYPPGEPHALYEQAAVVWRCVYHVLSRYADRNPRMLVVKHEDLSRNPIDTFAAMYERIGLPFDDAARQAVTDYTNEQNPIDADDGRTHTLRRNSRALVDQWRDRFTPGQVDRIRAITQPVAARWYGDEDWD